MTPSLGVVRPGSTSAVRDLLAQAVRPDMISLAGGLPDASLFPTEELAALTAELIGTDGARLLQYSRTEGLDDAREVLADHFELGDAERLLITTGSQQGLDLLIRVLIERGDAVVVAEPEYLGLLQVLRTHGAEPIPIRVDDEGLDVSALGARLAEGLRPKACYVVPHFHNPTGVTLTMDRRIELHRLSTHYGFVVIEDDPYRDLHHPDQLAPVDVPADPAWTLRLRSASKSLAPGLRVAVAHGPQPIHEAMTIAKQSADLHTATLNQAMVCRALRAPWFRGHLDRLRRSYHHKCETLTEALRSTFGDRVRFNAQTGGMFLWVDFAGLSPGDAAVDTGEWLKAALDAGACFVPGDAFAIDADLRTYARLSFATASEAELVEAVERLANSFPSGPGRA